MKAENEFGYNAATNRYENLVEAGVVDPKKVVRVALENAVSAAAMLLTTETLVVDIPEKENKNPGPAMPPMGMGGGF